MLGVGRAVARCALCLAVAISCASCGSNQKSASASATLQSAADATAKATSFTLSLAGADIVYQAPDKVQQVEHGMASGATATNGGSSSSSGPYAQTITKIFIGDRFFEADTPDGEALAFTVTQRCATDQNAADVVLRLLWAIAASTDVQESGGTYTFHVPDQGDNTPTGGSATVSGGFVRTLTFAPSTETVTIGDVNTAPPVTAPSASTPANQSCG